MPVAGAGQEILNAVASWAEVAHGPHRFGGVAFRVGHREVGHVHGDGLVDIPFPKTVRNELVRSGAAEPHHILPQSGWVSVYLRNASDIGRAIQLLRQSYEIALASQVRNAPTA